MRLTIDITQTNTQTLEEAIEVTGPTVAIIVELTKKNAALQEQLDLNSKNSSLPPSFLFSTKPNCRTSGAHTKVHEDFDPLSQQIRNPKRERHTQSHVNIKIKLYAYLNCGSL